MRDNDQAASVVSKMVLNCAHVLKQHPYATGCLFIAATAATLYLVKGKDLKFRWDKFALSADTPPPPAPAEHGMRSDFRRSKIEQLNQASTESGNISFDQRVGGRPRGEPCRP